MSWPKRLLVMGMLLALTACGFHPMYGKQAVDPAVSSQLASIAIPTIPDRHGQLLHNALLTRFNPRGEPAKAAYMLRVSLSYTENQESLLTDGTSSRNLVIFTSQYQLYKGDKVLAQGNVVKQASYDFLPQHYSDVSVMEDVQKRTVTLIADEIRNDIAAYFTRAAQARGAAH